ncbi:MAG: peptidylprolyl isomerase, partial [Acidobacteria bacterium]|nr:peptidylprolyl isomerase [Acidobacteriota bacterium]
KDSATSQFFINLVDNAVLDHGVRDFGYAVFARVVAGMDVVDKLAAAPTGTKGFHEDVPMEPMSIISARRKDKEG